MQWERRNSKGIRMQEQDTSRRGGAAFIWQWGGIAGAILALIQLLLSLASLGLFRTVLDVVVWLIGFFVVGFFTSRRTGRVGTGTKAGLVAGLISALVGAVFTILQLVNGDSQVTTAVNQALQRTGRAISASQIQTIILIGIIFGLIVSTIVQLGLGAGVGALGGLVGRSQAKEGEEERQGSRAGG
jgi:hypothetical protein